MAANDHPNVCKQVLSYPERFFIRLFLRKQMRELQVEIDERNELRRSLRLIQLIGLCVGATIGSGIYVLSGRAAATDAGPSIIVSFIITGFIALLAGLSLSEMASMMSSSGSVYTYTYVALGEYPAFIIGWLSTLLYQLGASTVVVDWSSFVVHFIKEILNYNATTSLVQAPVAWSEDSVMFYLTGQAINLPSIAITIAITIVLIIGIRETAIINLVFVVFNLIVLLIFIFAGCVYVDRKNYEPFFPSNLGSFSQYGVSGMLHASTLVFFAYVGFESVTAAAQEAKKPERSMPLTLIMSLVISLLIYVGVSTVMVGLVPYKQLNTAYPLDEASKATPYGNWLLILLDLGAIVSLTTVAISILLAQTRIFYAMAHDGLLPLIFARINRHTYTPWVSIVLTDIIGEITSVAALISYIVVHICVIVLRYTHDDMQRTFQVPFGSWLIPVVGSLLCVLLLINTSKGTGIRFAVWLAIGHIVYFSYGFWNSKARLTAIRSRNSTAEFIAQEESIGTVTPTMDPKLEVTETKI